MAGFRIEGDTSGNVLEVNADHQAEVHLPEVLDQAGFVSIATELDAGTASGSRLMRHLRVSEDRRLQVGLSSLIFAEAFAGSALNSGLWSSTVTTMATAVAAGLLTLNSGSSAAASAVARVTSYRSVPAPLNPFPTRVEIVGQLTFAPVTNNVTEWGLGIASGTTAPTDGAFFRLLANGEFRCVNVANSVEIQSSSIDFAAYVGAATTRRFKIVLDTMVTRFYVDDVLVATNAIPAAGGATTASAALPVLLRTYNSALAGQAQQLRVGSVTVEVGDMGSVFGGEAAVSGYGGHSAQGQTGATLGTTANYTNSANPTAAVPTNTTAALGSGLGGQFWETDTLAVTTDGIISSYQVPAGTAALPGKTLMIKSVKIDSHVQTALTGGPYVAQWSLAFGHTAVSLATAEAATTKAARRVPLGIQAVTSGQAVNTLVGSTISSTFDPPIAVNAGEFVATVKKKIGTAPSAGVIAHMIQFTGYWV